MQQKYPDTIAQLISFVITGYKYDYQILKELAVESNVIDSDIHTLLSAVHFYTTDIFKNDCRFEVMENDMYLFGIGSKPLPHEKQEEFVAKWQKRMSDIEFLLSEQNDCVLS